MTCAPSRHDGSAIGGERVSSDARQAMLARIAHATDGVRDDDPGAAWQNLARTYRRDDHRPADAATLDLLEERLVEYGVDVVRVAPARLPAIVADELHRRRARRVVRANGLDPSWTRACDGVTWIDPHAAASDLDAADAVVGTCAWAVADTGTVVLDGGAGQGTRASTLVPDVHLCIVPASRVLRGVPEAVSAVHDAVRSGRPSTWISGPSATSDIELNRVAGVHGPRTLTVLLLQDR